MHKVRRSTNERVLARHHALSKRLPVAAVEPFPNAVAGDSDDDDTNFGILGTGHEDVDDDQPHAVVRSTEPVRPTRPIVPPANTVIPTRPTATVLTPPLPKEPLPSSLVPNSVPAPPTTPSSVPPVVHTPITSATPSSTPTASAPSSPVVPTTANRGVSTASSASAAPETSATGPTSSKSSKSGISSGAVGGIVAVVVIIALVVIAYFVRKNFQRRRAMKRNTWGAGLVPSLENKRQTMYGAGAQQPARPASPYGSIPEHDRLANVPRSEMAQTPAPQALTVPPALATPSTIPPDVYGAYGAHGISVPGSAYNSSPPSVPISPFVAPSIQAPSIRSLAPGMNPAGSTVPSGEMAVVARTFIPTLPDELQISNAEQIRIISAYDDGWALCANARGEQGVVPLECLDRRGGAPTEMQLQPHSGVGYESNRTSRRMSSLAPAAPGTY